MASLFGFLYPLISEKWLGRQNHDVDLKIIPYGAEATQVLTQRAGDSSPFCLQSQN
jgi:hypothetical protein